MHDQNILQPSFVGGLHVAGPKRLLTVS